MHDLFQGIDSFLCLQHIQKALGRNLRRLIKAGGYRTLELFAHENGFGKSWIARIVRGEVDPGFTRVVKIARALEVDLNEIYPLKKKRR